MPFKVQSSYHDPEHAQCRALWACALVAFTIAGVYQHTCCWYRVLVTIIIQRDIYHSWETPTYNRTSRYENALYYHVDTKFPLIIGIYSIYGYIVETSHTAIESLQSVVISYVYKWQNMTWMGTNGYILWSYKVVKIWHEWEPRPPQNTEWLAGTQFTY